METYIYGFYGINLSRFLQKSKEGQKLLSDIADHFMDRDISELSPNSSNPLDFDLLKRFNEFMNDAGLAIGENDDSRKISLLAVHPDAEPDEDSNFEGGDILFGVDLFAFPNTIRFPENKGFEWHLWTIFA